MQYTPFASDIELPFYTALASLKINHDKLDDSTRRLLGLYEIRPADSPNTSCRMQVHGNALTSDEVPTGYYRAEGTMKNVNTIEEYRNVDKAYLLRESGRTIWEAIVDGSIYSCPSLLSSFLVLSYADLKKYKFHYWFAFPALHSDPSWTTTDPSTQITSRDQIEESTKHAKVLSDLENSTLIEAVQAWSSGVDAHQRGFFLARKVRGSDGKAKSDNEAQSAVENRTCCWQVDAIATYENGFFDGARFEDCFVCFVDPSNYENAPGWMLRNLLVLAKRRWGLDRIQILRYREPSSKRDQGRSILMTLASQSSQTTQTTQDTDTNPMPKVTGWERNATGKLTGRLVDLTEYLDPRRCLLLGAGTLGSYVARNLMGWGVTKITFVDNGSVSFSNPVRQPLFNFTDCLGGGVKKAHRASQAVKEIYPGVESTGYDFSVPMAGHPVLDAQKTRADFETLRKLIDDHDVVFLLMDTRESRWLPTVMGKAAGKIVMNAALGFDSFVVMRHGVKNDEHQQAELGCYFCNDVVAPINSVKDQTLDQQCTVTRPGVAAIASALLVELFVSLLQHPDGAAAPAPVSQSDDQKDHPLGLVPHQIRGFLSNFHNITIHGRSYPCCSACSDNIVGAYKRQGWEFVQKALNEPGYVEELSGLKEVQSKAEATIADIEWDELSEEEEVAI
ncbi:putative autophagy ubiquitin-activating enzyme ApgG [Aspergillus affinis]|uniref:putative autophagy ubiquitin-activating enzyme ApgG n=1 Tax=Aspergillus affinis TaxID=1070780 RepID=UPI0022FDB2CF|nr:autophagy-related protein 7 [Aspergillus affinis]KAI9045122.1 autophagy-related protein 7 [Aspergillus affinis]